MKRPSFFRAVMVALAISIAAGAAFATLAPMLGGETTLRLTIPLMGLAWLVCLLRGKAGVPGRVTAFAFWCAVSAAAWLIAPPLSVYLLVHVAALWLVRSLYFYSGVLPALIDMGLSALSLSVATWAMARSGSVFLAAWSFFLVQALFVFIPSRVKASHSAGDAEADGDEAFEHARRRADAALRQLLSH